MGDVYRLHANAKQFYIKELSNSGFGYLHRVS